MNTILSSRFVLIAILVCVAASTVACSDSPETRRKEAQSNADKYWELLKANNPQGAYDQTFSSHYKQSVSPEAFVRFNELITRSAGPVVDYQVVKYDANPQKPQVSLTYSVRTANAPDALLFDIKVERDGAEWRIASVEPQIQKQAPAAPPAPSLRAPVKPPEAPAKPSTN